MKTSTPSKTNAARLLDSLNITYELAPTRLIPKTSPPSPSPARSASPPSKSSKPSSPIQILENISLP